VETLIGSGISEISWGELTDETITEFKEAQDLLLNIQEQQPRRSAILAAPPEMRGEDARLWYPLPPSLPLMRRLKETLDPNATLNPGRFIGGI
jgi:hypothetical protein